VPNLWLSRSWTTRARRHGEPEDAYVFVDEDTFRSRIAAGGFVEWVALWAGQLSGTPVPDPPPGDDIVLEIDVRGAAQVKERFPDAVLIMLLPPSREVQEQRLRGRGDPDEKVRARLELSDEEEEAGRALADHVVVNDELGRAVDEVAGIVEAWRNAPPR
jgi:guanylate kinase